MGRCGISWALCVQNSQYRDVVDPPSLWWIPWVAEETGSCHDRVGSWGNPVGVESRVAPVVAAGALLGTPHPPHDASVDLRLASERSPSGLRRRRTDPEPHACACGIPKGCTRTSNTSPHLDPSWSHHAGPKGTPSDPQYLTSPLNPRLMLILGP